MCRCHPNDRITFPIVIKRFVTWKLQVDYEPNFLSCRFETCCLPKKNKRLDSTDLTGRLGVWEIFECQYNGYNLVRCWPLEGNSDAENALFNIDSLNRFNCFSGGWPINKVKKNRSKKPSTFPSPPSNAILIKFCTAGVRPRKSDSAKFMLTAEGRYWFWRGPSFQCFHIEAMLLLNWTGTVVQHIMHLSVTCVYYLCNSFSFCLINLFAKILYRFPTLVVPTKSNCNRVFTATRTQHRTTLSMPVFRDHRNASKSRHVMSIQRINMQLPATINIGLLYL